MIDLISTFYGFEQPPFRLGADYHFSYVHASYKKALAYMKFAVYSEEGFVMVTGRPGTGKTTLIDEVIAELDPDKVFCINLVTTQLEAHDLLHMVAAAFKIDPADKTKASLLLSIEDFLVSNHAAGRRAILIVDEAQGLGKEAIEELRLLSNLVQAGKQMLQVFLLGQEGLRDLVQSPQLEQLRQRIIAVCHLVPMSEPETRAYIMHRLNVAGWKGDPQIQNGVTRYVYHYSEGIPRKVNLIFGRLLLFGCIREKHQLLLQDMKTFIDELKDELLIFDDDIPPLAEPESPDSTALGFIQPARDTQDTGSAGDQAREQPARGQPEIHRDMQPPARPQEAEPEQLPEILPETPEAPLEADIRPAALNMAREADDGVLAADKPVSGRSLASKPVPDIGENRTHSVWRLMGYLLGLALLIVALAVLFDEQIQSDFWSGYSLPWSAPDSPER